MLSFYIKHSKTTCSSIRANYSCTLNKQGKKAFIRNCVCILSIYPPITLDTQEQQSTQLWRMLTSRMRRRFLASLSLKNIKFEC